MTTGRGDDSGRPHEADETASVESFKDISEIEAQVGLTSARVWAKGRGSLIEILGFVGAIVFLLFGLGGAVALLWKGRPFWQAALVLLIAIALAALVWWMRSRPPSRNAAR